MEISPEDNHFNEEEKSVLSPILKYLKVLKHIGGFPISVQQKKLFFSKYEFLKLPAFILLACLPMNAFTLYVIFWPDIGSGNFLIYKDIFMVELATKT